LLFQINKWFNWLCKCGCNVYTVHSPSWSLLICHTLCFKDIIINQLNNFPFSREEHKQTQCSLIKLLPQLKWKALLSTDHGNENADASMDVSEGGNALLLCYLLPMVAKALATHLEVCKNQSTSTVPSIGTFSTQWLKTSQLSWFIFKRHDGTYGLLIIHM